MRHFLFEDKEYKIRPRFRSLKTREQEPGRALVQLLRLLGRSAGKRENTYSTGRIRNIDARQKCTVKMQYSNSAAAHRVQLEHYLVREGTDIDGGQAQLYGSDIEEYRKNMTDRNFRIFLSPQSDKTDLKDLTEKFVKKLELATGYKLYWQGANHYNTAHPHAHLLINGTDRTGKQVEIPKDIVKTFMREYAQDICTAQLGKRTKEELALEKEKALTTQRYTHLDDKIKELCNGSFKVNLDSVISRRERERLLVRIQTLKQMNLCEYKDGGYKLFPRWEDDLRANGRYNTFLKARTKLRYNSLGSLKVFSGSHGQITGKVTKVYRTDGDASDNHAVILEAFNGNSYFVPLFKKPEMMDGECKAALREGELVSIKTYENQRGRLTPMIFKQNSAMAEKEIRKNGYTGTLVMEVLNGLDGKEKHLGKS
jgi:hypothetical protein